MKSLIDEIGLLSAKSQRLRIPITSFDRIRFGPHRLYLFCCTTCNNNNGNAEKPGLVIVKGMLKVGQKNLFIRRQDGSIREISPLCVLDFYVHESCQRVGIGRRLFEGMLSRENKRAHHLGYDRPSAKMLSFLAKHYCLSKYVPQANQFVIFDAFFEDNNDRPVTREVDIQGSAIPLSLVESTFENAKEMQRSSKCVKEEYTPDETSAVRGNRNNMSAEAEAITKRSQQICGQSSANVLQSGDSNYDTLDEHNQVLQRPASSGNIIESREDATDYSKCLKIENQRNSQISCQAEASNTPTPRSRYHAQLSGVAVAAALRSCIHKKF